MGFLHLTNPTVHAQQTETVKSWDHPILNPSAICGICCDNYDEMIIPIPKTVKPNVITISLKQPTDCT